MMVKMIGVAVDISEENLKVFRNIMNYVGISFQITDDILNLSRGMGKGIIAEDLHEKKFTIIVHFMRNHQEFMESFIHPNKSDQSIRSML
jgi:geranylgeranyl pyrophosphate synthase